MFKKTNKVEYSPGFKALTYSLYCSSELCYRSKLPFPSESCLRKTFHNPLNLLQKQLSSIENVRDLLIVLQNLRRLQLDAHFLSMLFPLQPSHLIVKNAILMVIKIIVSCF